MEAITIPISKAKIKKHVAFFAVVGAIFLIGFLAWSEAVEENAAFIRIAGFAASAIFFILASSVGKKLREEGGGIQLTEEGIVDASSSISLGLIQWKDITDIQPKSRDKVLAIMVKNPENYIKQAKNSGIKRLTEQNQKLFGSPVVLEAKYLDIEYDQLEEKIIQAFEQNTRKK